MQWRVFLVGAALALSVPVALAANHRPAGDLDSSFGDKGSVFVRAGGYSTATDVVVQPDRKVVLAGTFSDGEDFSNRDFLAVRLNRNGSRDRSFGHGGVVRTSVELGGMRRADLSAAARGLQGAIVLAGNAYKSEGTDFAAVRLKPSGVVDTSFSDDGVQTIDLGPNDALSGVAVQLMGSWSWPGPGTGLGTRARGS